MAVVGSTMVAKFRQMKLHLLLASVISASLCVAKMPDMLTKSDGEPLLSKSFRNVFPEKLFAAVKDEAIEFHTFESKKVIFDMVAFLSV